MASPVYSKVTLGGWAGHDDNTSLAPLTGYNNNSNYLAYLANAINQADPNVIGVGQRFNLDPGVIKANVLKSTGLQPGTVNVNGHTFSVGGEMTTSLWSQKDRGYDLPICYWWHGCRLSKSLGNFGFRKIRLPFIDKKGIIVITICRPI